MTKRQAIALSIWLFASLAFSHGPWVGPGADNIARELLMILDTNQSFSATASCRMTSPHPGEYLTWTMSIAFLNGKMRSEIDASQIDGVPARDPAEVARNKGMGISHVAFIFDPEKPGIYLYPDLNSYVEVSAAVTDPGIVTSNRNLVVSSTQHIEFSTNDGNCIIDLLNVSLDPPDAALFALPENSRKFSSVIDVVRSAGQAYYDKQAPH